MARPYKIIDWLVVDKLCAIQATGEEIADFLDISYDTLNLACKRVHKIGFTDYYRKKSSVGKISLRRAQWQLATKNKNPTMLIWLGKNLLNQVDRFEQETLTDNTITVTITDATRPSPPPQVTDASDPGAPA